MKCGKSGSENGDSGRGTEDGRTGSWYKWLLGNELRSTGEFASGACSRDEWLRFALLRETYHDLRTGVVRFTTL